MAPGEGPRSNNRVELHGWKEISDYLSRSVRTAQRWERELGLPIRRLRTATGETVYAVPDELDAWKEALTLREPETTDADDIDAVGGSLGAVDPAANRPRPATAADESASEHAMESSAAVRAESVRETPDASGDARFRSPSRRIGRRSLFAIALAVPMLAAAVLAIRRGPGAASLPRATAPTGVARSANALSAVLDPGPWPTAGHDLRRTNQSHLRGPRRPRPAIPIYEDKGAAWSLTSPIVTMDGHILLGCPGTIVGLDHTGREAWRHELRSESGYPEHPSGFTASSRGAIYFTAVALRTGGRDILQSHLYALASDGTRGMAASIGSSYVAPALGLDHSIYTLDEIGYLRSFRPWRDAVWGTTLGGFTMGGIAVDDAGNLYIGNNGGELHEHSLWSVDPRGEIRWQSVKETLGQPLVASNRVYAAGLNGNVYAHSLDGREVWQRLVGPVTTSMALALGPSGTLYVQTAKDMVALALDGQIKWRAGNGGAVSRAHPVVDPDENIYALLGDFVVSFTPNGGERWRVPVVRPLNLTPGGEGLLYVTTRDNRLYSIVDQ